MTFIDLLNGNYGAIQAIFTFFLVLFNVVLLIINRHNLRLLQRREDRDFRPFIYVYLQQSLENVKIFELIIGNFGRDVAKDLKFDLKGGDFEFPLGRKISEINIIRHGAKSLVPGPKLSYPFLVEKEKYQELKKQNIIISVSYKSSDSREFSDTFHLDFESITAWRIIVEEVRKGN